MKAMIFFSIFLLIISCTTLPKSIENDNILLIANYKWISKIGDLSISEVAADPALINLDTNIPYYPVHINDTYTFFTKIIPGKYIVKGVWLRSSGGSFFIPLDEFSKPFSINESGIYYIGSLDVLDSQITMDFIIKDTNKIITDINIVKQYLEKENKGWDVNNIKIINALENQK